MSKLRDEYDWIVIGDHPGALLSASLAAQLGLSSLILPLVPSRSVLMGDHGEFLDPENNFILGLGPVSQGAQGRGVGCSLLTRCLEQAGMRERERSFFLTAESAPEVLAPEARIRLKEDGASLNGEFFREWGQKSSERIGFSNALDQAGDEICSFWNALPERLAVTLEERGGPERQTARQASWVRRICLENPVKKILFNSHQSPPLGDFLAGKFREVDPCARPWFSSRTTIDQWEESPGSVNYGEFFRGAWTALSGNLAGHAECLDVLQLASLRSGAASIRGGLSAFRGFLLKLARQNGVDVPSKMDCQRIFVQNGRFVGVQPSGRGEMIGAVGGMLGLPLMLASPFISVNGSASTHPNRVSQGRPEGWIFTIALSVHAEALSSGLSRRMVWQEKAAPFLEIELTHARDYGIERESFPHSSRVNEQKVILCRTLMPMESESLSPHYQRMMAARMLRKLTEIFPFIDFHMERIFPDFRPEDARELKLTYGFSSLDSIPHNLLSFSGPGIGTQTGIEGLFVSSGESYPELGSLASAVCALEGTAWIARRSGVAGPFSSRS